MSFVAAYKYLYLAGLVTNAVWMAADDTVDQPEAYAISIGVLIANVIAWIGYVRARHWALVAEKVLSLSRMAMPILAAMVAPIGLVAHLSPLSQLVWLPALSISERFGLPGLWMCCAVLLGLEIAYFRALTINPRPVAVIPN